MTPSDSACDQVKLLTEGREQEYFFEQKMAFLKKDDEWNNCFSLIKLVHVQDNEELRSEKFDYGNFVFEIRYHTFDEGLKFLKRLEEGEFEISGYATRPIKISGRPEFFGSGSTNWYLRMEWPTIIYQYYMEKDREINIGREHLVSIDQPLFSDVNEALKTFFDLEVNQPYYDFSQKGELWVLIPDYRARFREIKLRYTKVTAKIETKYFDEKDLRIRVFAKSGSESYTTPLLKLKDSYTEFDFKHDLDYVLIYLLTTAGVAIDFKEWNLSWTHRRDKTIIVERPEEQIKNIIRQGEGQNLEFKYNIDNKQDFLETVVSFSNSFGGIIIIGVDDNGQVKGFKSNEEDILKMIHDGCEPPITPVFKVYDDINGFPIIVLEIESGENKPYLLKSKGIAYVRHGSNDFPPSRAELDQLYQIKRSEYSIYR